MIKIVLTGRPESGKTELFTRLQENYPKAYFIQDPFRQITEDLQEKKESKNFAETNPGIFGKAIIARLLYEKQNTPNDTGLSIQHSSLLDVILFAYNKDCKYFVPKITPLLHAAGYNLSLECEPINEKANEDMSKLCNQNNIARLLIPQTADIDEKTFLASQAINSYL